MSDVQRDEIERRRHEPGFRLVNVLPRESFRSMRIPGSSNLPTDEILERAPRDLPDRDADIVVYCGGPT